MSSLRFDQVNLIQVKKHCPTNKEMLVDHLLVLALGLYWVKTSIEDGKSSAWVNSK